MGFSVDDPRIQFVPFEREPDEGDRIMRDRWWVAHPERGLVTWVSYGRNAIISPQCNAVESITRALAAKLYPWAEVRFVPVAAVPQRRLSQASPEQEGGE